MSASWESIIKSVKRALRAISSERVFTDESLRTYLCEVESILNKRPLTPVSDDINDFEAITPDHLLIGYQNEANAIDPLRHKNNSKVQWKNVQSSANMFWKCWLNHYLPILTNQQKWAKTVENLTLNDLVIIKTKDTPRSHRPLGRILDVYPGDDGIVRSVKIRTPTGEIIRPSRSVCVLEKSIARNFHLLGLRLFRQTMCLTWLSPWRSSSLVKLPAAHF